MKKTEKKREEPEDEAKDFTFEGLHLRRPTKGDQQGVSEPGCGQQSLAQSLGEFVGSLGQLRWILRSPGGLEPSRRKACHTHSSWEN